MAKVVSPRVHSLKFLPSTPDFIPLPLLCAGHVYAPLIAFPLHFATMEETSSISIYEVVPGKDLHESKDADGVFGRTSVVHSRLQI